jgi:drug/metabolite transporter (DMT)-like permease
MTHIPMGIKPKSFSWSHLILIGTTLIWASTFPLLKASIDTISPVALVGSRFVLAALVLLPFLRRFDRRLIRDGALLGAVAFAAYMTQLIGLETTSANRAAFITSLNVILVSLSGLMLGRAVPRRMFVAAGLAVTGVGIMSWEGGAFTVGDLWEFGCAIAYAASILLMERFSPRHDPVSLTIMQLLTMGVLGGLWAAPRLTSEWPMLVQSGWAIAYLAFVATVVTTLTQTIGQRSVSAHDAAIIFTLEPVFAAVMAYWWLNEQLGIRGLLGASLVLSATLLSQIDVSALQKWRDRQRIRLKR